MVDSVSQNPMAFFNSKRWLDGNLFQDVTDEAVGQSGDRAIAKPALRMQPKTAEQLLQELRKLINGHQYAKLINFLNKIYQLAKDGNKVALNFYQKFDRALTHDSNLRSQIQSDKGLQDLVQWQFKQLSDLSPLRLRNIHLIESQTAAQLTSSPPTPK